jgi:hypothetical protein
MLFAWGRGTVTPAADGVADREGEVMKSYWEKHYRFWGVVLMVFIIFVAAWLIAYQGTQTSGLI